MKQTLFSANDEYSGWRFNNIQPIKDSKGNAEEGILLFYGCKDHEAPKRKSIFVD